MEIKNKFETSDFFLASTLRAKGKKVLALRWEGRRCFFQFSDPTDCQALETAFFNADLDVNAKEMANAQRSLKDRLFKRNGNEYGSRF